MERRRTAIRRRVLLDKLKLRRGWCEFIATDRDWRKKGIATALICATLREFELRGMTESALGVHVETPNMALRL